MPDESISLEETNKIRISLGLKPLGEKKPGKTETTKPVTKEQEAENNYAKKREQEAKDSELKCVRSVVH
jgi:U4/U6.U5 tri-snRNP-associated protein 1